MYEELTRQAAAAAEELCEAAKLREGQLLVIGCSTSEICGSPIGTNSSVEAAGAVFEGIYKVARERKIHLAIQCCEHLNRAIILEKQTACGREIVNVVPQPKAGGSFATAAWKAFQEPAAVEEIQADAGLDIGATLIGMHLKKVAVPVRLKNDIIGKAHVTAARTRPKYIGGSRAKYDDSLI